MSEIKSNEKNASIVSNNDSTYYNSLMEIFRVGEEEGKEIVSIEDDVEAKEKLEGQDDLGFIFGKRLTGFKSTTGKLTGEEVRTNGRK